MDIDLNNIDITTEAPANEPERQYYFMAKMAAWVKGEEIRLGRRLTACTQTFGCPMVNSTDFKNRLNQGFPKACYLDQPRREYEIAEALALKPGIKAPDITTP